MSQLPAVGDRYRLALNCLGNEPGTVGVVVQVYDIGQGPGTMVLFPNGNYDGFSPREREMFLEPIAACPHPRVAGYRFANVMQLSQDFRAGTFAPAFTVVP